MTIKNSISKLPKIEFAELGLPNAIDYEPQPTDITRVGTYTPPIADSPPGLVSPIQMDVVTTTTVSIPVPAGATSVDVEVIQTFTFTDAEGRVWEFTVNAYP